MREEFKTVEDLPIQSDPLVSKQKEDIAKMRTSLLSCYTNAKLASNAIRNITVLQVYHQLNRIIRYTEICDKLESKLYEKIDVYLDSNGGNNDIFTMNTLLNMQERLQKLIIDSNKILSPYLDMTQYIDSINAQADSEEMEYNDASITINLDATKREKLRTSAKTVLSELMDAG